MGARRFLDDADRRRIALLREGGASGLAIAQRLGIGYATVHSAIRQLVRDGRLEQPERVIGRDGKSYPAVRQHA